MLSLHSLAKLGCVLIRTTAFVLASRFVPMPTYLSDMLCLGRVCGQEKALVEGGMGESTAHPSPHGEAMVPINPTPLEHLALGCQQPVFMEPGRNTKRRHVSWGSWPTHQGMGGNPGGVIEASLQPHLPSWWNSPVRAAKLQATCRESTSEFSHATSQPWFKASMAVVDSFPAPHQPMRLETLCENGEPSAVTWLGDLSILPHPSPLGGLCCRHSLVLSFWLSRGS